MDGETKRANERGAMTGVSAARSAPARDPRPQVITRLLTGQHSEEALWVLGADFVREALAGAVMAHFRRGGLTAREGEALDRALESQLKQVTGRAKASAGRSRAQGMAGR